MSLTYPLLKLDGFQEKIQLEVLRRLYLTPQVSQGALASELHVALDSLHFSLQALLKKDLVKIQNFSQSLNKLTYLYLLTLAGLAEKSELTAEFLSLKVAEYELLQWKIDQLKSEIKGKPL